MANQHKEIRDLRVMQQGGLCCYCLRKMGPSVPVGPLSATLEHVLQKGNPDRELPENLKAACRECNQRRGLIWSARHLLPPICAKRQAQWFLCDAPWLPSLFRDEDVAL